MPRVRLRVHVVRAGRVIRLVDRVTDTDASVEVRLDRLDAPGRRQALFHLESGPERHRAAG